MDISCIARSSFNPKVLGFALGPLIDHRAVSSMQELVDDACALGATVLTGGRAVAGPGSFFEATVLDHLLRPPPKSPTPRSSAPRGSTTFQYPRGSGAPSQRRRVRARRLRVHRKPRPGPTTSLAAAPTDQSVKAPQLSAGNRRRTVDTPRGTIESVLPPIIFSDPEARMYGETAAERYGAEVRRILLEVGRRGLVGGQEDMSCISTCPPPPRPRSSTA